MNLTFYHYPKCKKSRAALEYIKQLGIEPVLVNYVEEGISSDKLRELFGLLNLQPSGMVRQQEEYYKENYKDQEISELEWINILSEYPKLLRRPIVVEGNKAVVADPPQLVNQLLTAYTKQDEDKN